MQSIRENVRFLIEDTSQNTSDIFEYGSDNVFTLSEENVVSVTNVLVNYGDSGVSYSYSSYNNKVTITSSLIAGDTIEIEYSFYPYHSDDIINNYIRSAVIYLSINNYYTWSINIADEEIYPEPTPEEENLIAMVTSVLINPNNISYRLPDITINVPNTSLPLEQKISKIIAIAKHNSHGVFDLLF